MKDTKYKILAYFDNQSYQKLFNEVNSDYAENLQILLHNLSLFSYDVLIIGVILYKEALIAIIHHVFRSPAKNRQIKQVSDLHFGYRTKCVIQGTPFSP